MNSLLPTGSSLLERRLASSCSGISDLQTPLRELWNPARCPIEFLPYLAWAFSVDRWDESWSEEEKRQTVIHAFYIHRHKGTVAAMRRVIENLGYAMILREWWQEGDAAGTFRLEIDVGEVGINAAMVNELERLIGDARPVSRHIAQLAISAVTAGVAYLKAASFTGDIVTVYSPDQARQPGECA